MKTKNIRVVTYRSVDNHNNPVPLIAIQGKFLESMGFNVGSKFGVEYGNNFVHISTIIQNRYGDPSSLGAVAVKR